MKNKKTLLLLMFVAVVVWGMVISRLADYKPSIDTPPPVSNEKRASAQKRKDSLRLNYRDPFLKFGDKKPQIATSLRQVFVNTSSTSRSPAFRMLGKIRKGAKDFLLVGMPGENRLIPLHGQVDGFTVHKIYDDSVIVCYNGQNYTVKLE